MAPRSARLRRVLSGFVAGKSEQEIHDVQQDVEATGATNISETIGGAPTTVCGVLKSVSLRPGAGVPAVEADLYDGSGHLTLVFLGRRGIAGIEPGRRIVATGRANCQEDRPVMYNPRYQLLPMPDRGSAGA